MSRATARWIMMAALAGAATAQDAKPPERAPDEKKTEVASQTEWVDAHELQQQVEDEEKRAELERWMRERLAQRQADQSNQAKNDSAGEEPAAKPPDLVQHAEPAPAPDERAGHEQADGETEARQQRHEAREQARRERREARARHWQKLREELQRRRAQREERRRR